MSNKKPSITIYGTYACPDCRRCRQFLREHQMRYQWVDVEEDKEGENYILQANDGKWVTPTIVFEDGDILSKPSNAELAAKLGLKTTAKRSHYDVIIIGGGPAGLTAAFYTAREGIDTLVIERAAMGGQVATTQWLDNVPGFDEGISGGDLSGKFRHQAVRFGVELLQTKNVEGIRSQGGLHSVFTADGHVYYARAIILATGSRSRKLNVPGEKDYIGAGIHFYAISEGPFYEGKSIAVVGAGNSATEESLLLTKFVEHITILVRGDKLTASQILIDEVLAHPQIDVRYHTEVQEFRGAKSKLTSVIVKNNQTGELEEIYFDGVFVYIGQIPNSEYLVGSSVKTNPWGYVICGPELAEDGPLPPAFEGRAPGSLETSVPGIFAAGEVRAGSTKQVASAAGEGSTAALLVNAYLKRT